MVKREAKENITLNLGEIPTMEGAGKKKRGRPRKTPQPKEVIIKELLPHQKFSHKKNKALDQLLEANREKEKKELEKGLRALTKMRGGATDCQKGQSAQMRGYLNKKDPKKPLLNQIVHSGDPPQSTYGKEANLFRDLTNRYDPVAEKVNRNTHHQLLTKGEGMSGGKISPVEVDKLLKDLPQFGSTTVSMPPFFAVPTKKGWRLANPLTEMRNLSTRKETLSVSLKRSNVKKPKIDTSIPRDKPTLMDFPKRDQAKLLKYYEAVKAGKEDEYNYKNLPRGFPPVLFKNAKRAGLTQTNKRVYYRGDRAVKAKAKSPEVEVEAEEEREAPEPKRRGRPPKYATEEEAYKAKLESNKMKRREKRGIVEGIKIIERPAKLIKGSQEAKDYMAQIKKYRGQSSGTETQEQLEARRKANIELRKAVEGLEQKGGQGKGISGFKQHSVMKDDSDNEDQDGGCDGEGSGGSLSAKDLKDLLGATYNPKKDKVNDFDLDKEISSPTSKVYFNKKTGQAVVAHRGTQGLIDWGNNAVYAVGGEWAYKRTKRYKEAKAVQEKAERKYGAGNVSTIGHSQGGLQSELLGKKSKEIITLNKATRPFGSKASEKQTDIRTSGDVVSALNPFKQKNKKEIVIPSKTYNPFTEHKTKTLEGLDEEQMIGEGLDEIFSPYNNIMPSQGGRMIGLTKSAVLPAHAGHPALVSDQYPRIPQSYTQVHLSHPRPMGCGLGAGMDSDSDSDSDMEGCGMRGGRTYAQRLRARARRAFAPVERFATKTFTPKLGRQIGKTLIHDALPAVVSGVVGTTATALTGSPMIGAVAGETLGKLAGKKAGDAVGKVAGMGMKRPKLVKGSKEAKEYMASIRSKRMKGGEMPPRSRGIVTDPSLL